MRQSVAEFEKLSHPRVCHEPPAREGRRCDSFTGFAFLPGLECFKTFFRSGALVQLLPDYRTQELGVYALYASRKHLPATTRTLLDFLLADLARTQEYD